MKARLYARALLPRQAIVTVTTRDGRRLEERARTVLGAERARALIEAIRQVERLGSVRALRPLLQA